MSYWNHRVVRRKIVGQPDFYAIHEAYYGMEDKPLITTNPEDVSVSDDDPNQTPIESLRETLRWMMNGLDKPVLDYDTREEI